MSQFRKKPVVIEAMQLRWDTWSEMCGFLGQEFFDRGGSGEPGPNNEIGLCIPTLEGVMYGSENDWIIRGVKGEIYPCKPDIFAQTYESAGDGTPGPTRPEAPDPISMQETTDSGFLEAVAKRLDEGDKIAGAWLRRIANEFAYLLASGDSGGPREAEQLREKVARLEELIRVDHTDGAFYSCDECGTSFGRTFSDGCPVCSLKALRAELGCAPNDGNPDRLMTADGRSVGEELIEYQRAGECTLVESGLIGHFVNWMYSRRTMNGWPWYARPGADAERREPAP